MRRKIYDLKNQRTGLLGEAQTALDAKNMELYNTKMEDVKKLNGEIQGLEALEAEMGRFGDDDDQMKGLHNAQKQTKEDAALTNKLDEARGSNEYARAWGKALRNGVTLKTGSGMEDYAPLYNALTIGGGTPAGSDGGFLVPVEFDNMIHRLMKDYVRLSDFFNVEQVTGLSGWRAVEEGKTVKPLPLIDEAGDIDPNDQPKFKKVPYSVKKYGDIIVVSSELTDDNTAGLMQYLAEWFAPKVVLTENKLLLALLNSLTATTITAGKEVKELKRALNKDLNTAHSRQAILLANQDSYTFLDELQDAQGRGLLVPDPTAADVLRFKARRIVYGDNDLLPNSAGGNAPLYIGNMKAFGTLFRRKALEFSATNIGGNAWRNDTTEVKGIVRMDAQTMDDKAVVKKEIVLDSEEE